MPQKVLFVTSYYPEYLSELYRQEPQLAQQDYAQQHARIFDTGFGVGDAYSHHLRCLGCEAEEVICDADVMQHRWAEERGLTLRGNLHDRRRQIVAGQVEAFRPDVLYVFEWSPLGDRFVQEMEGRVALRVGQIASSLPEDRTFAGYDLVLSAWPPIVKHFRRRGKASARLRLGFDDRVWRRISPQPPRYDVTFVGGFAPAHGQRIPWLERLSKDVKIDVFGYGLDRVPKDSPIHARYRGAAWGWRMYEVLAQSKITLHLNAEITVPNQTARDDDYACAMRFYEATGMGTCLVAEAKRDLPALLTPGEEIVAYRDVDEAVELIRYYLQHDREREAIAQAGQRRTLREHTYEARMAELHEILTQRLRGA